MDALTHHRTHKDEFFRESQQSPLPHPLRENFAGLRYFPPDPGLVLTLDVDHDVSGGLAVQTSDGQERAYRRAGRVRFEVDGEPAELTLYSTGQPGLFIPFRDATSGKDTYGAGRYLDLEPNENGTVTIDFNYAYNPFCAYDDAFSCPLPPAENWLQVPIRAGELNFRTGQGRLEADR